jgi:putative FmdB family regulatory protein
VPTYDYVCQACGHRLEVFQSMTEKRLAKCPSCGKKKLVRQVGAGGGLIFKGSGFYQTDYKKSATSDTKAETKSDGAPASASEAKTSGESRPAAKESAKPAGEGGAAKGAAAKGASPGTCAAGDS